MPEPEPEPEQVSDAIWPSTLAEALHLAPVSDDEAHEFDVFDAIDTNKDGKIDPKEWAAFHAKAKDK